MADPNQTQDPTQGVDDPSQTMSYRNQALGGMQAKLIAQQRVAAGDQAAVGQLDTAQQGARANLQQQAGRAFNSDLQQGGGGSNAGMRQAALSRGVAQGAQDADFSMQKIAAQRIANESSVDAAAGQTQFANDAETLRKQGAQTQADSAQAITDLDSIENALKNQYYIGDDDRQEAIDKANKAYGASLDPAVKAHLAQVIANIQASGQWVAGD